MSRHDSVKTPNWRHLIVQTFLYQQQEAAVYQQCAVFFSKGLVVLIRRPVYGIGMAVLVLNNSFIKMMTNGYKTIYVEKNYQILNDATLTYIELFSTVSLGKIATCVFCYISQVHVVCIVYNFKPSLSFFYTSNLDTFIFQALFVHLNETCEHSNSTFPCFSLITIDILVHV